MALKPTDRSRQEKLVALQAAGENQGPVRSRPANENDPALAMMLARLRRSPSYGVFYVVGTVTLFWVFGWFLVHSSDSFSPTGAVPTLPEVMRAVALLVVPIIVFWAAAYFQWRAQQLRQTSEALLQSALRLVRPQDIASENLSSIAKAVRHEVDLLVGGVEHAYQRATALEDIVHKEMSAVERAFGANEDRIRGLVSGLESQRIALQQTSQIVGGETAPLLNRLEANTQNLGQVINLALDTFNRLEGGLKHSSQELARTIEDVSSRAAMAGSEIGSQSQHFERMSTMLMSDFSSFSNQMQNYVQTLNAAAGSLSDESGRLGAEVKGMESSIINLLRQSAEKLTAANREVSETVQRFSGASATDIRAAAQEMQQTVAGIGDSITYHLKATTGEIATLIERSGVDTAHRIEESRNLLAGGMQDLAGDFVNKISKAQSDLTSFVDQAASQMNSNYDAAVSRLAERIDQSGAQMLSGLDQSGSNFLEQLNVSGGDFAGRIEQASAALTSHLNKNASGVVTSMSDAINGLYDKLNKVSTQAAQNFNQVTTDFDAAAQSITGRLSETSSAVAAQMRATGSNINDVLVSTSGTIATHLKETSDIVNRQMQDSGIAVAQRIESSSGAVTDRMITISNQFVDKLGEAQGGMLQLLESSASTIVADLQDTTSQVFKRLEGSAAHIGDQMESIALRVNDNIDTTAGSVTGRVIEVTDRISGQLDKSSDQLARLLDTTESRMTTQLSQATGDLTKLFSSSATAMTDQLTTTARELGERLDLATSHLDRVQSAFADGLSQTTAQITARFEQDTGLLVGRIDRATTELDSASSTSRKALDDAHQNFAGHVQTANTYFADQIKTAATELDEKLESVSMQLTGKLEVTGTRLSERLEDVTLLVDRSMDKFNNEIERMLESRRETLDTLVNDASKRSQEVDAVMTSYMHMIEESLTAAETRARDISRIVAEQTQSSLARLEDELKKLEGNSASQVTQAAKVLREQHERALSAMNEMLSSTATDFQQTAQDMRVTAQQVVRDIDSARNDLKRAVVDLPEETRNNADAMRKVVADQIAALSALSEVVRRQSGAVDFSGPGYVNPRGSGPGKSEGAPFSAPHLGTAGAQKQDEERTGTIEGTMAQIAASVAALSGEKAPRSQPEQRQPEQRQAASRKSGELPPLVAREIAAFSQKLSEAAGEVVGAVENGLPRDLEKRFLAGEREIFLKRLAEQRSKRYTAALAKRYGNEKLLRSSINTYIRLFEKLLDTLNDVPGGAATVDDVIASDNGQVYLMLAEASGRAPEA
jgi:hypothetical protein